MLNWSDGSFSDIADFWMLPIGLTSLSRNTNTADGERAKIESLALGVELISPDDSVLVCPCSDLSGNRINTVSHRDFETLHLLEKL